jgi:hypothetical protein
MRIFISGPYGDNNPKEVIAENVRKADELARYLLSKGHQVYCPHKMSWGWEDDKRLTTEQFYELDKSFLRYWANAIVRIPGESKGADGEMLLAKDMKLKVYELLEGDNTTLWEVKYK